MHENMTTIHFNCPRTIAIIFYSYLESCNDYNQYK